MTACSSDSNVSDTTAPTAVSASSAPAGATESSSAPASSNETITISWTGDNILGTDADFGGGTLPEVWAANNKAPDYFFRNVA